MPAVKKLPESKTTASQRRHRAFFEAQPGETAKPHLHCFFSRMTDLDIVDNRMRLIAVEANGRRVLLRVRADLYVPRKGRQGYYSMKKTATTLSCKDARQAEAALVSVVRMCMALDGLELDNPDLVMERL
jgi:hypothetical protein